MTADQHQDPQTATLTVPELAALTGLARASIYTGLEKGEIPGLRVGKRWVISRARIAAWLEQGAKP